jgi:hypothetical protein
VTVTGWASWPASVAQIWRKWASSRTAWRRSSSDTHDGKRDGTTTLFAAELVNLYETPGRGFYRVVASVFWGGLIQELAGISGGAGGRLTNRSGWAA